MSTSSPTVVPEFGFGTQRYGCEVCDRRFMSEAAHQMHLKDSKEHKRNMRRQEASTLVEKSSSLSNTMSNASVQPDQGAVHGPGETLEQGQNLWTTVPPMRQLPLLKELTRMCHSTEELLKNKYDILPSGSDEMSNLRRCKNCNGVQKTLQIKARTDCWCHPQKKKTQNPDGGPKIYVCCGKSSSGCISVPKHEYGAVDPYLVAQYQALCPSPSYSSLLPPTKRRAVALDCEMAGVTGGQSEVILICMVDFLTGENLINQLVSPTKKVVDWRTRVSGVTPSAMAVAEVRRQTLKGWREARAEVWKHVDADTILVGQSLQNDLKVLKMIHTRVVDSGILAKQAVGPGVHREWGLKGLCEELLGMQIQTGVKGHDCLEDALAAREVVLWCTQNHVALADWGRIKHAEESQKQMERQEAARVKREALLAAAAIPETEDSSSLCSGTEAVE